MIPDIETDPMLVQKDGDRSWIRLQPSSHKRREADYEWHLEHPSARRGEKPIETVSYLFVPKVNDRKVHGDDDDDPGTGTGLRAEPDEDADTKNDFLMDFARRLPGCRPKSIHSREGGERIEGLPGQGARQQRNKKLERQLEKQGVDWTSGPTTGAPAAQLQLTLQSLTGDAKIPASSSRPRCRGVVKEHRLDAGLPALRAVLESERNPIFDENEMVFGKIAPGESKSRTSCRSRCRRRRSRAPTT